MGIPFEENLIRPKKIFLTKQKKTLMDVTRQIVDNTGI